MSEADQLADLILEVFPALMKRVHKAVDLEMNGELSIPQLRILKHIGAGIDTAAGLAEAQDVSIPAVSKMVDLLAERDLIARNYRDGNRKQIFLSLTEKGSTQYPLARRAAEGEVAKLIECLSSEQRSEITAGLALLRKAVI